MIVSHVVAMGMNRVIGKDGGLPWHIPSDLKRFKTVTMGKMILMGRKTYDSIGRPLAGRLNIVVTRTGKSADYPEGVIVCGNIYDAIKCAENEAHNWQDELLIIGGGDIYRQTMDIVDQIYLSEVHQEVEGDTFYPPMTPSFKLSTKEECSGPPDFSWCLYKRATRD